MREPEWIGAVAFAEAAGISGQKARRALSRAAAGLTWRGHALEVRETHGRGGHAGLSYEVSLRSLSEALGEPIEVAPPVTRSPRDAARDQGATSSTRYAAIAPILQHKPRTPERVAAVEDQAKATGKSTRTLNRWLADYEAEGLGGLMNRRPSNAGQTRVFVSRIFDQAFRDAGYQDELLGTIAGEVKATLKGLWKSRREASGWAAVRRDAETALDMSCEKYGVSVAPEAMKLSRRHVEQFTHYRIVNIYKNDRKRYDDGKPRIRRSWTHLAPMDIVVADVKPLDVIVTRPDGSTA